MCLFRVFSFFCFNIYDLHSWTFVRTVLRELVFRKRIISCSFAPSWESYFTRYLPTYVTVKQLWDSWSIWFTQLNRRQFQLLFFHHFCCFLCHRNSSSSVWRRWGMSVCLSVLAQSRDASCLWTHHQVVGSLRSRLPHHYRRWSTELKNAVIGLKLKCQKDVVEMLTGIVQFHFFHCWLSIL